MMRLLTTIFLTLWLCISACGQAINETALDLGFAFGYNAPLADLKDRFGGNYGGDFSLNYYMGNSGTQIGIKLGFLTSDAVREDVFAPYRTSDGQLLSKGGVTTTVNTRMASSYISFDFQKNLFSLSDKETAKVFLGVGGGLLQHKIRFIEFTQSVPIAVDEYAKGLDRNTRGPFIEEQLGIKVRNGFKKFDIAIVSFQGFLKPVGAIEFDTGIKNKERRLDAAIGVKFKWYISLSAIEEGKDVYY